MMKERILEADFSLGLMNNKEVKKMEIPKLIRERIWLNSLISGILSAELTIAFCKISEKCGLVESILFYQFERLRIIF